MHGNPPVTDACRTLKTSNEYMLWRHHGHRVLWDVITYPDTCWRHIRHVRFGLFSALQWRHNERQSVSNHQCFDCLLNRLFRRRSKETSKLRITGLCDGISQGHSNAENASIWGRHHGLRFYYWKLDVTSTCQVHLCLVWHKFNDPMWCSNFNS